MWFAGKYVIHIDTKEDSFVVINCEPSSISELVEDVFDSVGWFGYKHDRAAELYKASIRQSFMQIHEY